MAANKPESTMLLYNEFMESDFFTLQASNSERRFKIHETLLRSISDPLRNACEKYKEQKERRIHFKEDVPEALLVAFLEWAYTRSYSDRAILADKTELASRAAESLHLAEIPTGESTETMGTRSEVQVQEEITSRYADDEEVMHPLLLHIGLYVFGDKYFIAEL